MLSRYYGYQQPAAHGLELRPVSTGSQYQTCEHTPTNGIEPQSGPPHETDDAPPEYGAVGQQHKVTCSDTPAATKSPKLSITTLDDWWVLELVALIASAGLLAAIIVLLLRYDDRPQPDWSMISLNTMVSWLGTLSRALVLLPVARSLGQLKWTWLAAGSRSLSDLRSFDLASRGVIGSIQLILSKRIHLHTIGCMATIFSVGFGPFLQNLIHYYPKLVVDQSQLAYITNSSDYAAVGPLRGANNFVIDPVLKANVYNSIFNSDLNQPWATPQLMCGTGNCTFEPITTLAAWAECANLTDVLHTTCYDMPLGCIGRSCTETCNVTIGPPEDNGLTLVHRTSNGGQFLKVGTTANLTTSHANLAPRTILPIVQYIMIEDYNRVLNHDYSAPTDGGFVAAECEIKIGVQALQDFVINSTHVTEVVGSWRYGEPILTTTSNSTLAEWWHATSRDWDPTARDDYLTTLGLGLPPGFSLDFATISALAVFIESLFDGNFQASSDVAIWAPGTTNYQYAPIDTLQSIFYGNFSGCISGDDHLVCAASNMAKALSKTFRDTSYLAYGIQDANVTIGQTQMTVSYVRIDWQWASLPFAVWVMAVVLWCGTALSTRHARIPAWANNILPLLFLYRNEGSDEGQFSHGTSSADYIQRTQRIQAQLRVSKGKAVLD